ncbi:hypothetical protein EYF80_030864 [Liparis tanakae]|uniref:Uncharacterized protein n=1 Tax=Liparis tanakae TaxID=230148 RepID=A0A4Z2H036_9TELE|nr:hypothetical protein EYF80_030864 [Liparis tanakae]
MGSSRQSEEELKEEAGETLTGLRYTGDSTDQLKTAPLPIDTINNDWSVGGGFKSRSTQSNHNPFTSPDGTFMTLKIQSHGRLVQ